MTDVGWRDFPKFIAVFEFLQDSAEVQKNLKEIIAATKDNEVSAAKLEKTTKRVAGVTTYEEGVAKLNEEAAQNRKMFDDQSNKLADEIKKFTEEQTAWKSSVDKREASIADRESQLIDKMSSQEAQLTKREQALIAREQKYVEANTSLHNRETEFKKKVEAVKGIGL